MRSNPHLFEAAAFPFLHRISESSKKNLKFSEVPDSVWRAMRSEGFDCLWLMGVWKRSPGARMLALNLPELREAYSRVLPGWSEADVLGSPYAIYEYSLDPALGEKNSLYELKKRVNQSGLQLILDFVPNHLAFDHPWTISRPELFISSPCPGKTSHPEWFFESKPGIFLAHGRDPYFPPWTDSVQVNYFSSTAREAMIGELLKISEVCDGVRCDMAMLSLNDVFEKTWGAFLHHLKPQTEFWPEAISRVRQVKKDFIFIAEAYWDTGWRLQQAGFDFTYDKTLYDRLLHSNAAEVKSHLFADAGYQNRSVRFIENHDESRAATVFGSDRSRAAAVVMATVPGMRFFYDGQMEGKEIHVPVQLVRHPEEAPATGIRQFYKNLLGIIDGPEFHEGNWGLLRVEPDDGDSAEAEGLLAWAWEFQSGLTVIAVNYSDKKSRGKILLPLSFRETHPEGISIDLPPWGSHIMKVPQFK